MDRIAYFGCWRDAGHFLWFSGWEQLRDFEVDRLRIPRDYVLDASIMFLPPEEKVGEGVVTYLPAPNLTIFAWWGSPFDSRGKVNCALIIEGRKNLDEAWELFKFKFPDPADDIKKPCIKNK